MRRCSPRLVRSAAPEDQIVGTDELYSVDDQARRIAAVRRAVGRDFFINARTDAFMKASMDTHDRMVDRVLERAARQR
jgi:2-methylisocitrate lyase-like PEP mutase family enzyme